MSPDFEPKPDKKIGLLFVTKTTGRYLEYLTHESDQVKGLSRIESIQPEKLKDIATKYPPQLVILDASSYPDWESQLTDLTPTHGVVVLTASPTWRRARTAFNGGALDYVSMTLVNGEISITLEEALQSFRKLYPDENGNHRING